MKLTLSKHEIKMMINIIQSDIAWSEQGQPDFADVEEMRYYADRADLMETLKMHMGAAQ